MTGLVLAAAAPLMAACGSHHSNLADANNIGTYVKAGPVTYQLEVSRELNRYGQEDSGYLTGLPKHDASLAPDQVLYGVFLTVTPVVSASIVFLIGPECLHLLDYRPRRRRNRAG